MAAKESQGPFSRPVSPQRTAETKGQSPGEQNAGARLRVDVPAAQAAEQWQRTFDAVPDLLAILDTQHRIVRVNQAMADRLGLAKEQCVGQTCYGLVHGTDGPPPFCPHAQLLQDGNEHAVEVHEERLAGDFLVSVSPLLDSTGCLAGSVHVAHDITEHKRAEQELREREKHFRDLAELLPQTVYEMDLEGRLTFVNRQALHTFGYTEAAFEAGVSCFDMLAPEEVDRARQNVRRVLQGQDLGGPEYTAQRKDGTQFPVAIYSSPIRRGDAPVGVRGIIIDVTERKQAEKALRDSERRYRTLVETAQEGIGITDSDESIIFANQAFADLLGYTKDELVGLNLSEITDEKEFANYRAETQKRLEGKHSRYETVLRTKSGQRRCFSLSAAPLHTENGTFFGTMGLLTDITERKQAERELRESEARFAELFANMSSGVAVYEAVEGGRDFVFKDFNKAGERIECTTKEKVIGRRVTEVFPGVKEFGLLDVFQQVWRTGRPQYHPIALYKDERIAGWRENYVYRLPSGEVVAVYDDVTARKRAEEDLIESESKFRAVFENAGGAILIADTGTGKILDCNLQAQKLLGRSRAELVGMHQSQLHPEDEEEKYRQKFAAHVREGQIVDFEGEVQHADGRKISVWIATQTMTLRGKRVIVGLFLDISERKQMEETLRESNELFKKTFTSQRDAIFILDARSPPMILDCNPATTKVFGYTRQEMLGRTTAFLHVGETRVREFQDRLYPAIAQRGFLNLAEFEMKRKGGTVFPTEHTVMPLDDNQGEHIGWVSVVRDITERKRAEKALRRSEKMQAEAEKLAATGRMAAQIAHEINNPLAGIKNCFRLIRDAVPEDHPDRDMVGLIEREIDRVTHVVQQMYKLHSPQAERPTDVPVEETIRDVLVMLEPLARVHEVAIEVAPVSPKLSVKVPEGSLQQVVYNLTVNAIQASPRSGIINILAEPTDEDYVRISICDRGPGIPAEVQDRMFEPFFSADTGSRDKEGIGLGLSIVKSIVESLEGKIEFESRAGEGTCFHVYLPSKQP